MKPDFKDSVSKRKPRRQSSVTIKTEPSPFTRLGESTLSFWHGQWHIVCVALLILSLSCLSLWALNLKTDNRVENHTEETTLSNSAASVPTDIKTGIRRHKWVTLPLTLPPSEEDNFKKILQSHNLVQRTAPLQKVNTKTDTHNQVNKVENKAALIDEGEVNVVAQPVIKWQNWKVRSGDNLATMAKRHGVKASEIHYLMQSSDAAKALKRIYPKQTIRVQVSDAGEILQLQYDIKDIQQLTVNRKAVDTTVDTNQNPFEANIIDRPYEIQTAFAQGSIDDSLFMAGMKAGISDRLTMELAGIFGWDIDFVQDIRAGDRFSLLFEERYRDGERLKGSKSEGNIIAAEFINNGRKIRALRYTLPDGRSDYFTPEGKSLRKAFIRNPVDFARISSRFNLKRKHPILNKIRAHRGVDYAAPTGTPIRAAGDGKVVFRGKKGGYGNTVIIQHGQRYSTLYAHMSKYARGSNNGRRVRQGQVIGYIGSSGLATGPHLHYEFRVNGVHRNPLTIKHPSVKPIPKEYLDDFKAVTADVIAQLDVVGQEAQYASLRQ